jgi:hypothetical protein
MLVLILSALLADLAQLIFFSTLQHFFQLTLGLSQVFFSSCSFLISFAGSSSSAQFLTIEVLL